MTATHCASLMRSTIALAEKPPKIDGMRRADARASEHGDRQFRTHAHVDRDAIALLHAERLQDIGELADFGEQLLISEGADFAGFAFPDDSGFVGASVLDVTVETVVGEIDLAADEPFRPRTIPLENFRPRLEPVQLLGDSSPELFGIFAASLIKAFVVFEAFDVSLLAELR